MSREPSGGTPVSYLKQTQTAPRKRRFTEVALLPLSISLILALGGLTYTTYAGVGWKSRTANLRTVLNSVTAERDQLINENTAVRSQFEATATELSDANDRIRALANEKAQVGDEAAVLSLVLKRSAILTQHVEVCIADLQNLQVYLVNHDFYASEDLLTIVRNVNSQCDRVRAANAALAESLAGR